MYVLRLVGTWFLLASAVVVIYDVSRPASAKAAGLFMSLGSHWFKLHAASITATQAAIERHLHRLLWDPFLLTLLKMPAWTALLAIGLALHYVGRRRRRIGVFAN